MKATQVALTVALSSLAACGGDANDTPKPVPPADAEPGAGAAHHGEETDLGVVTVAGRKFNIIRQGELVAGEEGAFEVRPEGFPADEFARLNLYLWAEDDAGTQLSAPAKGSGDSGALHFHLTPRKTDKPPVRVVLRVRAEGADESAGLPLDGHGHEHHDGPHGGVLATFSGAATGHLELKLHDDKGDLELWLGQDARLSQPFDLALDTSIKVEFIDVDGRTITMSARNSTTNEDEEGNANVRVGRTNYFIYPAGAGDDASWLRGVEFQSIVIVRFSRDGRDCVSEEFVLKPHVH